LVDRTGSLFHSPEWCRVLADTYGWEPRASVLVDTNGTPTAGVPWCLVSDPGGDRVISLPFSDYAGPIGAPPHDPLFDALEDAALPVRCRVLATPGAPAARPVVRTARWHGIDLDVDLDAMWARLGASSRRAIAKARREGVAIVERTDDDFLPYFLRLHTRVRTSKYRLLPQPLEFFAAMRNRFHAAGGWLPLAAVRDGTVLAATVYLRSRDTLYYKFNASDPATLGSRPNDLLLWAGIELGRRLGCHRLDLGASDDDQAGLIRFKRGYASEEREIQTLASGPPLPPSLHEFRALLTRLTDGVTHEAVPDELAQQAGAVFYRYFA
jgi:CelD/BcsL family acetyltransferase involved in cellulose biosynthesis